MRPAGPSAASVGDALDDRVAEVVRRDDEPAVPLRARVAGERVEELGEVGADVGIGGEQADVLVEVRR